MTGFEDWEWIDKTPKVKMFKEPPGRERSITVGASRLVLRAGNLSSARLFLQRHRMDVQERGGGLQIERVHARYSLTCVAMKPYRPR